MATWDSLIEVSVVSDAPAVTRQGFTVGMIASPSLTGGFTERIRYYESNGDVAADTDVDAATAEAAEAYFAACGGNGRLGIGRVTADQKQIVDFALAGTWEDGDTVTINIDGTDYEITCSSDTPTTLGTDLRAAMAADGSVDISGATTHVICTSKAAGQAFTYSITKTGVLGVVGFTETQPVVSLSTSLSAILAEDSGWFGFALLSRSKAQNLIAATWAAANERLFVAQSSDADILAGTGGNLLETFAANGWTVPIIHYEDDEYAAIGALAERLLADPDVQASTWAWAQVTGVTASPYTAAERNTIEAAGGNCFLNSRAGVVLNPGILSDGTKVDVRITKAWAAARSAEEVTQRLVDATARHEKIAYTDPGLAETEGALRVLYKQGVAANHFVAGSGVFLTTAALDAAPADRANRLARQTLIVRLAGAIESVAFRIKLT